MDYTYDGNGNLSKDLNKDIGTSSTNGITYNLLNLPSTITVTNKGTISYVYDAAGNKLQKTTTEGSKVTTTLYMFGNYINDTLQYLPQEEGRIRFNTDSVKLEYDYFIKDHLGNVRMVLTEAQRTDNYPAATMELVDSTINNKYYGNISSTRSALPSGYPTDNSYSNPNQYVAKTNGSGNKIGPAIILKVMAGDKFNVRVSDWYNLNGSNPQTPYNPVTDLVTALTTSIGGIAGSKGTSTELSSSGILNPGILSYYGSHNNSDSTTKPKAFLNWVAFDEQMNYVASSSGFMQVGGSNQSTVTPLQQNGISITKNGYFYVYVSNETPNIDVYFDNLQVTHVRGPLLEETHYYPFGLTMQGISSSAVAFGSPQNKKKFNKGSELENKEFIDGSGLETYSTLLRELDPQLGRWWQIDPKPDYSQSLYSAMNNNPISINDPFGDEGVRFEKDDDVTKKEFKQFKKEVRTLRRNSETFRNVIKDLKKHGGVTFVAHNHSEGGEATLDANGRSKINVGIHSDESARGGSRGLYATQIGIIAHETGHSWMKIHNLEGVAPSQLNNTDLVTGNIMSINKHNEDVATYRNRNEIAASDIGNVILSEAIKSGVTGVKLQDYYYGGFKASIDLIKGAPAAILRNDVKLNTLSPPHDENYYMNNKIDIYEEYEVKK